MELLQAIQERRSIRKFKPDPVKEDDIRALLEAGRLAPSGTNLQPTRYVVIKSDKARKGLMECTPLPFVAQAPIVLACCIDMEVVKDSESRLGELREAKAFVDTPLENDSEDIKDYNKRRKGMSEAALKAYLSLNAAIAIDHITLRAVDLGLASCWIMMFDHEKVKNLLGLEARYQVVALLPIGYPDQQPKARPRLSTDQILLKEI